MKKISIIVIVVSGLALMAFATGNKKATTHDYQPDANASFAPVVVLELFTSQGCSSCPSADLLLQKVKREFSEEVFALSYHVDYWNYIGWQDPFSKAEFADKQRIYNTKFKNRSNYTPQLVLNGKEHFVGSNTGKMYNRINAYKNKKVANRIELTAVTVDADKVHFSYTVEGDLANKTIRPLLVLDERTTMVKRGENRNRTLKNSNIVVAEATYSLDEASGSMQLSIPEIVTNSEPLNLIVLIENTNYDVTAAAKQKLLR